MLGKFIVIEGIDGCGKTTQIKEISTWLPNSGLMEKQSRLVKTREPGGSDFGLKLREILLDNNEIIHPDPLTELLLYSADRSEHISKVILPALNKSDWVISDRFSDSTLAYQGFGRGLDKTIIKQLENIVCQGLKPDLTIFLEIPPKISIARRRNKTPDRIESEGIKFLEKVDEGFQIIAKEKNWEIISASQEVAKITDKIKDSLIRNFG